MGSWIEASKRGELRKTDLSEYCGKKGLGDSIIKKTKSPPGKRGLTLEADNNVRAKREEFQGLGDWKDEKFSDIRQSAECEVLNPSR